MNIPLNKHPAEWVAEQVSAGRYASEFEAIEDALATKMREDEAAWKADGERLRQRLHGSERQIERGEYVVADDAFFESKKQMIRDRYPKSEK